jgi:peptidoglycan/LPS O-acetylase OafA/YrhL
MIKYRAEIDGLRTVAVIPVLLFHLGYGFARGGFYGVDVFFVISGYLITKILTEDIENGNFSMVRFWVRRVKRLLPLLLTVILVVLSLTPFLFKPIVKNIGQDLFPALFSYYNFHALFNFGDYWGPKAEQSFFLHTWSLSVEEQFYLLYPFFLFFSHKYFKNFIIPLLTLTLISLAVFAFCLINEKEDLAFYVLPTRIWELCIGGLVGILQNDKPTPFNTTPVYRYLPIIGICFIGCSYLLEGQKMGVTVLLPVAGAALILLFCTPTNPVGKILSSKAFVYTGKISYSLYLWHWVILILFQNLHHYFVDINHHFQNGLIILSSFLLAIVSYTFVENKTRNYKHTPKLVLVGIVLMVGITFYIQSDLFKPYYNSKYNHQIYYSKYYNAVPKQKPLDTLSPFFNNIRLPKRLQNVNDAYKKEGIIAHKKYGEPKIILLGDSHGVMWAKLLNEISDEFKVTFSCYATGGNKPFFNIDNVDLQEKTRDFTKTQRVEYAKSILKNIEKWQPKIVVLVCRWGNPSEKIKLQLNELLQYLEKRNINVLLFTQPPVLTFIDDRINTAQYFTYLGIEPVTGYNVAQVYNFKEKKGVEYIKSLAKKYGNVRIYDVFGNMISGNKAKISLGKDVLYFDDDHLSYIGTAIHKENISSIIKTVLNAEVCETR